ncbi:MAG: PEP-CTERM sorting domain-containing protein [Candidatus Brocadiae bacterium]|nr:PEP-CTERM sorting domain-containing protein [Candidatus Brocadiia bacterium]
MRILVFIALVMLFSQAQALLMLNSSEINEEQKQVISFTQFANSPTMTQGPVEVDSTAGVTVQWSGVNTNDNAYIGNDSYYSLGNNGVWNTSAEGYTALNNSTGSIRYTFNQDVSSVGAFMNYLPDSNNHVTVTAYNRSGQVIETYDINNLAPISTFRGTNQGAFRGIQRTMADIAMFEVSNSYVVLDHLSYGITTYTPEPSSLFMALAGMAGGLLALRKNRKMQKS